MPDSLGISISGIVVFSSVPFSLLCTGVNICCTPHECRSSTAQTGMHHHITCLKRTPLCNRPEIIDQAFLSMTEWEAWEMKVVGALSPPDKVRPLPPPTTSCYGSSGEAPGPWIADSMQPRTRVNGRAGTRGRAGFAYEGTHYIYMTF